MKYRFIFIRKVAQNILIVIIGMIIAADIVYNLFPIDKTEVVIDYVGMDGDGFIQLYYKKEDQSFSEDHSVKIELTKYGKSIFEIPSNEINEIRIDVDEINKISVKSIQINKNLFRYRIDYENWLDYLKNEHNMQCHIINKQGINYEVIGEDPHILIETESKNDNLCEKMLYFVILSFMTIICVVVLYFICRVAKCIKSKQQVILESRYRFTLIASVGGILFSFLIVPWQTPDEYAHLQMIGKDIGNTRLPELLMYDMSLDWERIRFNSTEKVDKSLIFEAMIKKPKYLIRDCVPTCISIKCIRHLPATAGILLGILLKLPTYWVLQLGELFSLTFYIFVCNKALILTPLKRETFEMVMLLPMCIHQASSISYDAVLLPLSFLLVAYILHLKFVCKEIRIKDLLIPLFLSTIIAVIKLPYILLGGLIFLIPLEKVKIKIGNRNLFEKQLLPKIRFVIMLITVVGVFLTLTIMRNYEYIRILNATISEFRRTCYLFSNTYKTFNRHLIVSLVGNFGWLDTPIPLHYICIFVSTMIVLSLSAIEDTLGLKTGNVSYKINNLDKITLITLVLALTYIVTISMIRHTACVILYGNEKINVWIDYRKILYKIPYIGGLQGRYYIPMLIPFLITFPNIFIIERKTFKKLINIIDWSFIICICHVLLMRYW